MKVKNSPGRYHAFMPYPALADAVSALLLYKQALEAAGIFELVMPDGRLGHAVIGPGGPPVNMHLHDSEDPLAYLWWVATDREDVAPEELQRLVQEMFTRKEPVH